MQLVYQNVAHTFHRPSPDAEWVGPLGADPSNTTHLYELMVSRLLDSTNLGTEQNKAKQVIHSGCKGKHCSCKKRGKHCSCKKNGVPNSIHNYK